jgi:tRNA(Ile)-lysidine synthase
MASVVQKWFTTHQIEVKQKKISVRFRQGGERIHLAGHKHHSHLKKLLQAANIPPWQRDRIPLIYFDNRLIMIYPDWSAEYESIGKNI